MPARPQLAATAAAAVSRRLRDPLRNPRRAAVHAYVLARPGATFREVARGSGTAAGTARHHLSVLKRLGLVVERPHGATTRFFENHGRFEAAWRSVVVLREEPLRLLHGWLQANQGTTQKRLLGAMLEGQGWSRSTTQHRLRRLEAAGLVQVVAQGRFRLYSAAALPQGADGRAAGGGPASQPQHGEVPRGPDAPVPSGCAGG